MRLKRLDSRRGSWHLDTKGRAELVGATIERRNEAKEENMKAHDISHSTSLFHLVIDIGASTVLSLFPTETVLLDLDLHRRAQELLRQERGNYDNLFATGNTSLFHNRGQKILCEAWAILSLLQQRDMQIFPQGERDYFLNGTSKMVQEMREAFISPSVCLFDREDENNPYGGLLRMVNAAQKRTDGVPLFVSFFCIDAKFSLHRVKYHSGIGIRHACSTISDPEVLFMNPLPYMDNLCPNCFGSERAKNRLYQLATAIQNYCDP